MYFLSLFPLSASVGFRVEKLQRDFLLEGISDEFKYYLVSWSKVCTLISEGGMGLMGLREKLGGELQWTQVWQFMGRLMLL